MPVDGKCPRCGFKAPVMCFADAAEQGLLLQVFAKLPQSVQAPYLKYMSLFRPLSGCAMQGSKAARLTSELVELVAKGYVSQKDKVDRPCSPSVWAMGMERMQEQAATLILPMKNHNYLRSIVYQIADQADAGRERNQHQQVLTGTAQAHRDVQQPVQAPVDDGLSQLERQYLAKHGHLPGMDGEGAITCPADLAAWARKNFAPDDDQC